MPLKNTAKLIKSVSCRERKRIAEAILSEIALQCVVILLLPELST